MTRTLTLAALCAIASAAPAQHVDILLFEEDGKFMTGAYDYNTQQNLARRVVPAQFDGFYSVNNPGYTANTGANALPGSEDVWWDFMPMHTGGLSSTLLYWDTTGSVDFGATPTDDYELSLFGKNAPATADGGSEIVPGDVIETSGANGYVHEHRFFFLDDNGDGTNATLPDMGIYLIAMRHRMASLEDSDPYVMVWATPESAATAALPDAIDWVEQNFETLVGLDPGLEGDFNGDGLVDAADYSVWRDGLGSAYTQGDYDLWSNNYGAAASAATSVPEPAAALLLGIAALLGAPLANRRC